jgi:hypothetical protein
LLLQLDPTAAIAPSADLVAWSRLGSRYDRAELDRALRDRDLVEYRATLRPADDIALYRAEMAVWPGQGTLRDWQEAQRDWVRANDACRRDIPARLTADGPLTSRELPDTCAVPWRSTGWTNDRNVIQLLGFMVRRGEVAVAGRRGKKRRWDLAERVYPDIPDVPLAEAERRRDERRLSALGIARPRGPECPVEPLDVRDAGEEAVVEGVKGTWRVDPSLLDQKFTGRAALGGADRERGPEPDLAMGMACPDLLQQQVGGGAAELVRGLVDRGQWRRQPGGERQVVIADNRYVRSAPAVSCSAS